MVLSLQGRPRDAIEVSSLSVRIDPDNDEALYNRAVLTWYYEGRKKRAVSLLKRAVMVRPDYGKALKTLAKYAGKMGNSQLQRQAESQYRAVTGQ